MEAEGQEVFDGKDFPVADTMNVYLCVSVPSVIQTFNLPSTLYLPLLNLFLFLLIECVNFTRLFMNNMSVEVNA